MRSCRCPNCDANITVDDENREYTFCQYCGSKIMFDDYRSTQRIIDEAKIKQAETERIVRLKELELEETRLKQKDISGKILFPIWIVLSLIVLAIVVYEWVILGERLNGVAMLFYIGGPVIGGGAHLIFKVIPEKEAKRTLIQKGGIKFPKSLEPFTEQDYTIVQETLQSLGFCNITCVNLHDLPLGFLSLLIRPGKVSSISVNGQKIEKSGEIYLPNAPIVIRYHGK